jgi:hypothetical protein
MELFDKEDKNRDYLFDKLKDNKEISKLGCFIDKEIPVPYKNIYIPIKKSLEIWCSKQDLCIYQNLFGRNIDTKKISISADKESIFQINVENHVKRKDIGIPFVIVETKMSKATTHELIASSEKINMIKTMFPYCKNYLLVFGVVYPRVYRLCPAFDEILYMENLDENNCEIIIGKIVEGTKEAYYNITCIVSQ